jgi:hypothetical protein
MNQKNAAHGQNCNKKQKNDNFSCHFESPTPKLPTVYPNFRKKGKEGLQFWLCLQESIVNARRRPTKRAARLELYPAAPGAPQAGRFPCNKTEKQYAGFENKGNLKNGNEPDGFPLFRLICSMSL